MRARTAFRSLLTLAIVLSVHASVSAQAEPSKARLGEKMPNLTFKDDAARPIAFTSSKTRRRSSSSSSPSSAPSPIATWPALGDRPGVRQVRRHHLGPDRNEDDTPAQIAKAAKQFDPAFPVFKDERLRAADALKADFTPEVFVLDGNFVLKYRGRIDNMYSERLKKHAAITAHNLSQTLAELVTGRPVSVPATQAVGCKIYREKRELAKEGKVTYHRDVLPILQKHCQECHRPGEVGPFALMTYKQAVNWAADIKDYTQRREMRRGRFPRASRSATSGV